MLYILRRVALPITGRPWDGVYTASSGKSVWRAEDTHLARAEQPPMAIGPALRRDAAETAEASTEQIAWSIDSLRPTRQEYLHMR